MKSLQERKGQGLPWCSALPQTKQGRKMNQVSEIASAAQHSWQPGRRWERPEAGLPCAEGAALSRSPDGGGGVFNWPEGHAGHPSAGALGPGHVRADGAGELQALSDAGGDVVWYREGSGCGEGTQRSAGRAGREVRKAQESPARSSAPSPFFHGLHLVQGRSMFEGTSPALHVHSVFSILFIFSQILYHLSHQGSLMKQVKSRCKITCSVLFLFCEIHIGI